MMMKTPMIRWMLQATLVGVAALSVAWAPSQERGAQLVTYRWVEEFGMLTPANGQTLRLHAVQLFPVEPPPDPDFPANTPPTTGVPPGPCRVELVFFDADGAIIGAPVFRTLDAGKSTFVDLPFGLAATNTIPPGPCRASVWVFRAGRPGEYPPNPCRATLEVLDTASGKVSVHLVPAVQHALPAVQ
jgi:hypothetical protein